MNLENTKKQLFLYTREIFLNQQTKIETSRNIHQINKNNYMYYSTITVQLKKKIHNLFAKQSLQCKQTAVYKSKI